MTSIPRLATGHPALGVTTQRAISKAKSAAKIARLAFESQCCRRIDMSTSKYCPETDEKLTDTGGKNKNNSGHTRITQLFFWALYQTAQKSLHPLHPRAFLIQQPSQTVHSKTAPMMYTVFRWSPQHRRYIQVRQHNIIYSYTKCGRIVRNPRP